VKELFKTSKGKYVAPVPESRTGWPSIQPSKSVRWQGQDGRKHLHWQCSRPAPTAARIEVELTALLDRVNAQLEPHEALDFLVG